MQSKKEHEIYELVNTAFKDITLCLGGIFLARSVKDKTIWETANSIEDIYYKTMAGLEDSLGSGIRFDLTEDKKGLHPHPAIESLLNTINFKPARKNADRD
jgi:hypothetical protein